MALSAFAGEGARATRYEDGAGVAEPGAVCGLAVEADVGGERIGAVEQLAGLALRGGVIDNQIDTLVAGEIADDFGVDPGDGIELARPIRVVVGPG